MADYNLNTNPTLLFGDLVNTKAQAVNEMGAIAGTLTFMTFFKTELASQVRIMREVFA
ncbi:hypothetical protein [uncultured archaeal virus]|uniref:Uncharacterized protein n=1 Tax=uncultured archaeal virus TaxID=1960247 RepID=A0A8B0LQ00_9VIRU|nr:hypothetical protein [uncultured archaeal virus]